MAITFTLCNWRNKLDYFAERRAGSYPELSREARQECFFGWMVDDDNKQEIKFWWKYEMLNKQDRNASLAGWSFIVIRISNNFKFIYCIGIYVLLLQNSRISRNKVQNFGRNRSSKYKRGRMLLWLDNDQPNIRKLGSQLHCLVFAENQTWHFKQEKTFLPEMQRWSKSEISNEAYDDHYVL